MGKKKPKKIQEEKAEQVEEPGIKLDLRKTSVIALFSLSAVLVFYDIFYLLPDANPTPLDRLKTFIYFFIVSYGLGYTLMSFVRRPDEYFEKYFMTFAVGLSSIPIITLILDTFGVPLDATLLLIVSAIYPAYHLLIKKQEPHSSIPTIKDLLESKSALTFGVILLFASIYLHVLLTGALQLPYLEDDDSWDHAVGAKYVSILKTYSLPKDVPVTHYLEPYPPTYDGIMGILHQLNTSVQWTLKFFNALLIGLSIIMAYYFIKLFTGDERIALGGSFILAVTPCYLSHFIWAHTLGHVLFYPTLYAVEMANKDKKWSLIAITAVASTMVVQPMISLVFGLIYILYYVTRVVYERKILKRIIVIGVLGLAVAALFFWGQMIVKYGSGFEKIDSAGKRVQSGEFKIAFEKRTIPLNEIILVESFQSGEQDKCFLAPFRTMQSGNCATLLPGKYYIPLSGNIAIQKGFGIVLFALFIISLLLLILYFRRETQGNAYWIPVSIIWSAFTFIGLESWALPFSVDPPRFFMFMTLPMAIIVPKGVLMIVDLLKKHAKPEYVIAILLIAVLYTSAYPKYIVQTAMWPYGVMWVNQEHLQGYAGIKEQFPPNAKVFPLCMQDSAVIGMDKLSYPWDKEVLDFRESVLDKKASQISNFLKNKGYEYAILDVSCIVKCDTDRNQTNYCIDKVNQLADDLVKAGLTPAFTNQKGVIAYKVN